MKLTVVANYIVLIFVLAFGFFAHLSDLLIALWDESRLAMNAYEMLERLTRFVENEIFHSFYTSTIPLKPLAA